MRLALALILSAVLATPAAAYRAQNGLIVTPQGADSFVVPYKGFASPTDFWCAAGDYASNKLRLPLNEMLYRASEPPRRSGEGILFSLRPEESARSTGLLILGAKRGGITIGAARAFCEIRRQGNGRLGD